MTDQFPICEEHNCPMVPVGETGWECVIERLCDHLVGRAVVRKEMTKSRTMLVFDDGHELDLLCPECGGALHAGDDTYIFEVVEGMTLSAVYYNEPGGMPGLLFVFSSKCNGVGEVVCHAMTGKRMRCPEGCQK
jgi:hypothetical protein